MFCDVCICIRRVRVRVRDVQCLASESKEARKWISDMTRVTICRLRLLWYSHVVVSCMLAEDRLSRVNENHRTSSQTFNRQSRAKFGCQPLQAKTITIVTPAIVLCCMCTKRRYMYIYRYGRGRLTNPGMPALSNAEDQMRSCSSEVLRLCES